MFKPIAQRISHYFIAFHHARITALSYHEIKSKLIPGDIFLTRTEGEVTNLFIPGFWSHVAIYNGDNIVIEAIGRGVVATDSIDFLLKKDFVCVLRPKFATEEKMSLAVAYAQRQVGKPYDYDFEPTEQAFYCAELVAFCYDKAMDGASPFVPRVTLGVETFVGDDFYNATDKFERMWCNKEY